MRRGRRQFGGADTRRRRASAYPSGSAPAGSADRDSSDRRPGPGRRRRWWRRAATAEYRETAGRRRARRWRPPGASPPARRRPEPRWSRIRNGLGLIVAVMGEEKVRGRRLAAPRRSAAGTAPRAPPPRYRIAAEGRSRSEAAPACRAFRRSRPPRPPRRPSRSGGHDRRSGRSIAGRPSPAPPPIDDVEQRQRIGAAGDRQGNDSGPGDRREKRLDFAVGQRLGGAQQPATAFSVATRC